MGSRSSPIVLVGCAGSFIAARLINWVGSISNDKAAVGISNCETSELQQGTSMAKPLSFALSQQVLVEKRTSLFD